MFSSKIKKVLATVLVIAMTVTSAGFNTLAASVTRVANVRSEVDTERQKGLSYKYYEQFKAESVKLLMGDGDKADGLKEALQGSGDASNEPSVKDAGDTAEKEDAGVGAKQSDTDDENKTTSDDSSSLNENKDENKNENKTENKTDDNKGDDSTNIKEHDSDVYGPSISSDSDAEEDGENKKSADEEEPEEDVTTTAKKDDDEETASPSDIEDEEPPYMSAETGGKWWNDVTYDMYDVDENREIYNSGVNAGGGKYLLYTRQTELDSKNIVLDMISSINNRTPGYSFAYQDDKTKTNIRFDWGDDKTPTSWRDDDQTSFKIYPTDNNSNHVTAYVTKGGFISWDLGEGASWVSGYAPYLSYKQSVGRDSLPGEELLNAPEGLAFSHWSLNDTTVTNISSEQTGNITLKANWVDDSTPWRIGNYIYFGTYPQSSTDYDVVEPIKWIIASISKTDNKILVVSDKALDIAKYFEYASSAARWDFSKLRESLNDGENSFYNKAFNEKEKAAIVEKDIKSLSMNEGQDTVSTIETDKDHVFVLDSDDINDLRSKKFDLPACPTTYAKQHNGKSFISRTYDWNSVNPINDGGKVAWWTRRGQSLSAKEFVVNNDDNNTIVSIWMDLLAGVRPAIWVDLESEALNSIESSITWEIGSGEWLDDSTWPLATTYREGIELKLPTTDNFKANGVNVIDGWFINDDRTKTYTEIPTTQTGDITLTANWKREETRSNITWEIGEGVSWADG